MKRDDVMIQNKLEKSQLRKKEIIKAAMQLFSEKGYEQTSMRDIAKNMGVSLGLCYRYFDSKQILFNTAIEFYIEECCEQYLDVLHDPQVRLQDKIKVLFDSIGNEHPQMEYYDFFHRIENQELHEQLSIKLCKYMYPHLLQEVKKAVVANEIKINNPETLVSFITYGQIGLLSKADTDHQQVAKTLYEYVVKLLDI